MRKNRTEIVEYINSLKGYEGYVQFSDTKIRECDVFKGYQDIKLEQTDGFVFEAHFFNGTDAVTVKQLNGDWYVDESKEVPWTDVEYYKSDFGTVKMSQIWETKADELCEGIDVMKLKKVVFSGFEGESR